jgi:hypothetical protein
MDVGMTERGMSAQGDFVIGKRNGGALSLALGIDWSSLNVAFGLAPVSFGGGERVIFVANRDAAPTSNPTAGVAVPTDQLLAWIAVAGDAPARFTAGLYLAMNQHLGRAVEEAAEVPNGASSR